MNKLAPALLYFTTFLVAVVLAAIPSCGGVDCKDPKNASRVECKASQAGQAFIDCAKADLGQVVNPQTAETLLAKVAVVVLAGGNGWQQALEDLGKQVGSDALACAVKAVDTVLLAQSTPVPQGSGSGSGLATGDMSTPKQRAEAAISMHGWKFGPPASDAKHAPVPVAPQPPVKP